MTALLTTMATSVPIFVPTVQTFDYSAVSAAAAADLRRGADLIRQRIRKTTADIIETGHDLASAKERLDHGQFASWVQSEIGIALRTAQAYMASARLADAKGATVALLPPSTMHRLAQKSAPQIVVDTVVEQAKAGTIVPDAAVVEMIAEARHQQREATAKDRAAAAKVKRKGRRSAIERHRTEYEAQREQDRRAACEIVARILDMIGDNGARLVLAELVDTSNLFTATELRKLVGTAGGQES